MEEGSPPSPHMASLNGEYASVQHYRASLSLLGLNKEQAINFRPNKSSALPDPSRADTAKEPSFLQRV